MDVNHFDVSCPLDDVVADGSAGPGNDGDSEEPVLVQLMLIRIGFPIYWGRILHCSNESYLRRTSVILSIYRRGMGQHRGSRIALIYGAKCRRLKCVNIGWHCSCQLVDTVRIGVTTSRRQVYISRTDVWIRRISCMPLELFL